MRKSLLLAFCVALAAAVGPLVSTAAACPMCKIANESESPTGEANRKPVFMSRNVQPAEVKTMGSTGKHLRMTLEDGGRRVGAIGFGMLGLIGALSNRSKALADAGTPPRKWIMLTPDGASASSSMEGEGPELAVDGDPSTLWAESGPVLRGAGEWIELTWTSRVTVRRVRVVPAGGPASTQTRWIRAGSGYGSSSEPVAFFGLGSAASVERVEVRWSDTAARERKAFLKRLYGRAGLVTQAPKPRTRSAESVAQIKVALESLAQSGSSTHLAAAG